MISLRSLSLEERFSSDNELEGMKGFKQVIKIIKALVIKDSNIVIDDALPLAS